MRRLSGCPGRLTRLRNRNKAPLFCGQPAQLRTETTPDGFAVELLGPDGAAAARTPSSISHTSRQAVIGRTRNKPDA